MDTYHSGKTISRVLDGIASPELDPGMRILDWTVERCISEAEANAIRRARFPNNRPPGANRAR